MGTGQGNYSGQAVGAAVTVMVNYLVAYLAALGHTIAVHYGWVEAALAVPAFTTEMVQSEQLLIGLLLTWWMTKEGVRLPEASGGGLGGALALSGSSAGVPK